MSQSQESLDRVCQYRGLPALKVGVECEVDGKRGIIVGGNSSANLSVIFDGQSHKSNCHPYWRMKIFNRFGGVVHDSDINEGKP